VLLLALLTLLASQIVGLFGLRRRGEELLFSAAMMSLWLVAVVVAGFWLGGVG
jgi:hypothetical protein